MPILASYCSTFLKPEMLHIYRQITGLSRWQTFVIAKERIESSRFPFDDVELAPVVRSNFVRRYWLKHVRKAPPIVYRGEYGVLDRLLRRRSADLMHVYFGHTGVHLLPFLKQWPHPSLVSFHGMDVQPRRDQPGYEQNLRELLQSITLVLARSYSLRDRLLELGCPKEKFRLNRTGIPLENFPFASERTWPSDGAWHFVQACRLIEKKGLDVTLRAFAGVRTDFPKARLTLAGDGPLLAAMQKLAEELGIAQAVRFCGFLDQTSLCELYRSAHIFIHPSQITSDQNQEGIPNSMLEAMSTGLPVVATNHGGIPEAVEDGVTGFLGPEREVAAAENSLRHLITNQSLWEKMSRAAHQAMQANFEQKMQVKKLEEIYDEAWSLRTEDRSVDEQPAPA